MYRLLQHSWCSFWLLGLQVFVSRGIHGYQLWRLVVFLNSIGENEQNCTRSDPYETQRCKTLPLYCYTIWYITLRYIKLHHITSPHLTSHHITSRQVTSRMSSHVKSFYVTFCYITLHYITLQYVTLRYITLQYITLHYIISYHIMSCHVMSCTSCHVMSCHVMLCKFHKRSRNCNANTKQLSTSEFVYRFQNTLKKYKDCNFILYWFIGLVYANVIIHLSVGEKPSIFTSTSVNSQR